MQSNKKPLHSIYANTWNLEVVDSQQNYPETRKERLEGALPLLPHTAHWGTQSSPQ